mmetsp:Transcript_116977/g.342585  ORF Transcript_116977/g.342585 Transcript_116977/m.342585 type:complete len:214 (+) Transcript_116977:68-709(+)
MPGFCTARQHAFCGGCNLVLPNRAFSISQLQDGRDPIRRCKSCVGTSPCISCQSLLPLTDFSSTQQRKPAEARKCNFCLTRASPASSSASGRSHDGGADMFWRWATAVTRALARLPAEVVPRVLQCLCQGGGLVELGAQAACAVCDARWPCAVISASAHCASPGHRRCLAAWRVARAAARECAMAARSAGLPLAEVEAQQVVVQRPGRRWGRR